MSIQYTTHPVSLWLSALLFILIHTTSALAESQACQYASRLVEQSYHVEKPDAKRYLNKALRECPTHAEAHKNLAVLMEKQGDYSQAIAHYKQALQTIQNFPAAWYGLGEISYKQGQFPLSLEAHLHACQKEKSKKRVLELLENKRYAITEKGQILNKESLLLLYDKQQRERINRMIADCDFSRRGDGDEVVKGKGIFRNLTFDTGKATLTKFAKQQIKNLAAAFNQTMPSLIKLHGHTDSQGFRGIYDPEENKRLNLKLSQQRAKAVKRELVAQGVYEKRIQIRGYGQSRPLVKENSVKAWAKNRRVEIESVD